MEDKLTNFIKDSSRDFITKSSTTIKLDSNTLSEIKNSNKFDIDIDFEFKIGEIVTLKSNFFYQKLLIPMTVIHRFTVQNFDSEIIQFYKCSWIDSIGNLVEHEFPENALYLIEDNFISGLIIRNKNLKNFK